MSEPTETTSSTSRPSNVTDLPETGKTSSASGESRSGGGFWKLSTFVLLALLLLSGGWNFVQQRMLDGETQHYADLVAAETRRADAAEQEVADLRESVGDVHESMTALQDSLSQILASTGALLAEGSASADDEATLLDAVVEGSEGATEAVTDAAGELPDVGAPREAALQESLVSRVTTWFGNLFSSAE